MADNKNIWASVVHLRAQGGTILGVEPYNIKKDAGDRHYLKRLKPAAAASP